MEIVLSPFQNRAQPKCIRSQNANQYSFHIYFRKSANGNKMSCSLCTFPTCPPSSSVPCPTADCGQIFCCQDHLNRWVRYLQFARPVVVKKVWSFEFFTETSDRLQLLFVNVSWFPVFLVSKCSRLVRHRHNFWFPGLYWFWTDSLVYSGFWFNWFLSPSQTPNRLVFWFLFWEFLLVNAHCSTAMSNRLAWPSVTIWVIKQVGLTLSGAIGLTQYDTLQAWGYDSLPRR